MTQVLPVEQEVKVLKEENYRLQLRVKDLENRLFGSKADRRSDKGDSKQTVFTALEDEVPAAQPQEAQSGQTGRKTAKKASKPRGPKPLNPNLPRIHEQVADPDLNDLICPVTGKLMRPAMVQSIEVLARKPAEYYVRVLNRNVFVSEADTAPVYRPWPNGVMPRSRVDASLIASVLVQRFADHQPYYRQCEQLGRLGLEMTPNTLMSIARVATEYLSPLYESLRGVVLKSGYVQMDHTPLKILDRKRPGAARECGIWTYRTLDGPMFYEFVMNKSGEKPRETLKDYQGILQTDGASNFGGTTRKDGVIHLVCFAHARRYFVEAQRYEEEACAEYLNDFDRLFRIEKLARYFKLKLETLKLLRQRQSFPVFERLMNRARSYREKYLMGKTPMAKAINYLLNQEPPLRACLEQLPSRIDNNLVENAIRPLKLGSKNWLFIGHEKAGPRNAILFTLIQNCRLAKVNPEAWLIDVLHRLDDHPQKRITELLPHNWLALSKNSPIQTNPIDAIQDN